MASIRASIDALGFGRYQHVLLLIAGIGFAADGMEMFVMGIAMPHLPQEWQLGTTQLGALGGSVFLGMGIGTTFWGSISDSHGRRNAALQTIVLALVFGLLSALATNFLMLMFARTAFGFAIGGFIVCSITLLSESLPSDQKGFGVGVVANLFAVGASTESLFAIYILPSLGWRWLLGISAAPLAIPALLMLMYELHESPIWLESKGRKEQARTALARISELNGTPLPPPADQATAAPRGAAQEADQEENSGDRVCGSSMALLEFARSGIGCRVVVSMVIGWTFVTSAYYCYVFSLPSWLSEEKLGDAALYINLASALIELPSNYISARAADKYGRRPTLTVLLVLGATLSLAVGVSVSWHMDPHDPADGHIVVVGILLALKVPLTGSFLLLYILASEVFPTPSRSLGLGMLNTCGRIGGALAPMIGELFLQLGGWKSSLAFSVWTAPLAVAAFAAWMLPFEPLTFDVDSLKAGVDANEHSPLVHKPEKETA